MVRELVNICADVISLITILAVFPIIGGVGGIAGVVIGSVFSLKGQVTVSVSYFGAPGIAACKAMHATDYILWKG